MVKRKQGRSKQLLGDTIIANFADLLVKDANLSEDIFLQLETELFKLGFEIRVSRITDNISIVKRKGV